MASSSQPPDLMKDTLCPICQYPMENPVSVDCGHNFCKGCVDQYFRKWSEVGEIPLCPVCRVTIKRENIRLNWQLKSLVENVVLLSQGTRKGDLCVIHKEKVLLFCKEDEELMCLVCEEAAKHKGHSVLQLEEAAPTYKDQIMNSLKTLRARKEEVLLSKNVTEMESKDLLEQVTVERENTVRTFRQIHRFLEKQEELLLAQMEEAMEEIKREMENHLEKLEKERQSLESTIQELEEKLHQPVVDLLQGIESFMQRCKVQKGCEISPITFPVDLRWKIWDFSDINPFLEGVMNSFQDSLVSGLELQKVNVHLDPETAHKELLVSEDCKSVRWTETPEFVPDNPERFDFWPFVLGREEFTAGRHFWEVLVGSEEVWFVGVARKNIKRKGQVEWGAAGGIWPMGKGKNAYRTSTAVIIEKFTLIEEPKKIRVALNCEGGRVAFYDADRGTQIYVYSGAPFARETLCPLCSLYGNAHLAFPSLE